jgi:CheY-like chemotaxis protein
MKPRAAGGVRRVLLLDDEPDILESFKGVVEPMLPGVEVVTAQSGREGIEALASQDIDLIISDFKMPGMDGIEFLVQARRLRPAAPRVMYTAFGDEELRQRATAEAGVQAFLSKSLGLEELVASVQALLDGTFPR